MLDTRLININLIGMRKFLFIAAATVCLPSFGSAHEFWIDSSKYQVENGESIVADLRNGQKFEGVSLPFNQHSFERFDVTVDGVTRDVVGRIGDRPGLNEVAAQNGLHVYAYQSKISHVTYKVFEKFQSFADHKDFKDMQADHTARGLPVENFKEAYTRYAKALIAVGDGNGNDVATGLETELVALQNPYVDDLGGVISVQAFYQGKPRAQTQIELFAKSPDGAVEVSIHQTNDDGIAVLPAVSGVEYLVDAVVLRVPDEAVASQRGAVWETLWASLTYSIPPAP